MAAKVAMMANWEEQGMTRINSQIIRVLMGGLFT